MVAILREADREPAGIVAKRHKVSEQTIYNWRKKFGALSTDEVRRLKQLEAENARLKKLVVDRDLEIEVMIGSTHCVDATKDGECAGPLRRCDVCD
jgi:putative transposase